MNFGERFLEAFENASITEIANRLDKTYQGVKNYTEGRIPSAEILLDVYHSTGCSLHWLLTGEGPKYAAFLGDGLLEAEDRHALLKIAEQEKKPIQDVARELIIQAIDARNLKQISTPDVLLFRTDIQLVPVPLVGSISANKPIDYFKEQKSIMVAETFIQGNSKTFVLRVDGSEWTKEGIFDGDMLICADKAIPQNGQVIVATLNGSTVVKRWFADGDLVRLQAVNGKSEQHALPRDQVAVVCVVVGVQRTP